MYDFPSKLSRATLVLGGARSGKSAFAERLARHSGLSKKYVATAEAFDDEMAARIARHREDRGIDWRTVDAPRALPEAICEHSAPDAVVLVDCLTLWLSNRLLDDAPLEDDAAALDAALAEAAGPVICVSNEVGLSLVPETRLGRVFRDAQGRLNQRVAARAGHVVFVAAGLPLTLKAPI